MNYIWLTLNLFDGKLSKLLQALESMVIYDPMDDTLI